MFRMSKGNKMKKFILITPLALLLSMFSFNVNLEAAGCNSHKNKNLEAECRLSDETCDNLKSDENSKKVDA